MKKACGIFLFATIASLFSGCKDSQSAAGISNGSADSFDVAAVRKAIEAKNNQFTSAHLRKDSLAIDTLFAEDGRCFPPNSDAIVGRPAIAALTAAYLKFEMKEFTEATTYLYGNKEYVVDEGTYSMTFGSANTVEKGKYVNVWKNVNGDWKLYSNIWNANVPVSPPK